MYYKYINLLSDNNKTKRLEFFSFSLSNKNGRGIKIQRHFFLF